MVNHKRKQNASWRTYIYMVLKQVHPDLTISNKAMTIMSDQIWFLFRKIINTANELTSLKGKNTMTAFEVQSAVRLELYGEIAKHGVYEGNRAVTTFIDYVRPEGGKSVSKTRRAALTFPAGRMKTLMKKATKYRIGSTAPLYMTAVLEYVNAEIIELSGNSARDNKSGRILPRHIMLAVKNDEELHKLFRDCIIAGSGVMPHIHMALLPKDEKRKEPIIKRIKYGRIQTFTSLTASYG